MAVPIFIVLLFAAAVAGVYAWVSVDDEAKAEHTKETDKKLECARQVQELRAAFENWKTEVGPKIEEARLKSLTAEAVSVDIRDTMKGKIEAAEQTAKAASEIAHQAATLASRPQKIHMEGSLKLEREKKEAQPRRSP